jgi:hypothetical protein
MEKNFNENIALYVIKFTIEHTNKETPLSLAKYHQMVTSFTSNGGFSKYAIASINQSLKSKLGYDANELADNLKDKSLRTEQEISKYVTRPDILAFALEYNLISADKLKSLNFGNDSNSSDLNRTDFISKYGANKK